MATPAQRFFDRMLVNKVCGALDISNPKLERTMHDIVMRDRRPDTAENRHFDALVAARLAEERRADKQKRKDEAAIARALGLEPPAKPKAKRVPKRKSKQEGAKRRGWMKIRNVD